ncbi:MAG: hypothetical protein ACR2NM_05170, partial [Bythopirellula sp.]
MTSATSTSSAAVVEGIVRADDADAVFFAQELTARQKMTRRFARLALALGVLAATAFGVQAWRTAATASTVDPNPFADVL